MKSRKANNNTDMFSTPRKKLCVGRVILYVEAYRPRQISWNLLVICLRKINIYEQG